MKDVLSNIQLFTRILQVIFSIIVFADAAYILYKGTLWGPDAFRLAVFAGVTGMLLSMLMIGGPPLNGDLAERLPGFIDIIFSAIWALLFLSAGGAIVSYGRCDSWYWGSSIFQSSRRFYTTRGSDQSWNSYCAVWTVVLIFCFLSFALYAVGTVLAGLDLMQGKGLVKPRGFNPQSLPVTTMDTPGKSVADLYAPSHLKHHHDQDMKHHPDQLQKPPTAAAAAGEP